MGEEKTYGILLKKTLLANDDAFLEFFTEEYGKIKLSVRKFGNSKKRKSEIDFFRLLEIGIFEGRNSKSLHSVSTLAVYSRFSGNLELSEKGFSWLGTLDKILPEEKPTPILFKTVCDLFQHAEEKHAEHFDLFFQVVMLNFLGFLTRFDEVKGDCFFSPQTFQFSPKPFPGGRKISNAARQIIEFLRRSNFSEFYEKKEKLPPTSFLEVEGILEEIEKYHL